MQAGPVLRGSSKAWKYPAVSGRGHRSGASFCLGREFPAGVQSRSPSEPKLPLDADNAVPGREDRRVAVKLLDDKNLDGHFGDGSAIKLARNRRRCKRSNRTSARSSVATGVG